MIGTIAAVALGALFAVAGATKLAAGPNWPMQAARLKTPRAVAVAVPWVEIVVGIAVASGLGAPVPAIVALALLAAFTADLVVHLRRDDHPPCACFGGWSSAPLSWRHVARNGALAALAILTFF